MTVETMRPAVIETPQIDSNINRSDFGPGEAGQRAYDWVIVRLPCEAYTLDENGEIIREASGRYKICGKPCEGTVDFDVPTLEQIPVCRADQEITRQRVMADLRAQKGDASLRVEINGFNRP